MMSGRVKVILVLSLAFNIAVLGTVAFGWIQRAGLREMIPVEESRNHIKRRSRHLAKRIGLPDEKARHFERIMHASSEETLELRKRLGDAREELMSLLWQEEPDSNRVMEKVEEIAVLQGEMEKLLVSRLLDTHSILDREERAKFLRFIGRRMGPPHHRKHIRPRERHPKENGGRL